MGGNTAAVQLSSDRAVLFSSAIRSRKKMMAKTKA
ncbi:hypothetical protein AAur_3206 [Paenarthrobacter aurescens TC1]|uniref:Uncharacterized protein n=1 Tax=Paenarthrobacter aurescens (strain TC1) TaxID=290340 RepID=A1R9J1_PAEAT|nr:hypothetical protein AAur_3206 [Paenarthrobacter aurescens TC1]